MNRPKAALRFKMAFFLFLIGLALPGALYAQSQEASGDFNYWFDRGELFAVYGNQDAAIQAFQKALKIEPQNSDALFGMGLAYAEKGDYKKGIEAVNNAINIDPDAGRYHYGRGWIHMLAGDRETGLADMEKAAALESADAKKYLEQISPRHMAP